MKKNFIPALLIVFCFTGCGKREPAVIDYQFDVPDGFEETQLEGLTLCYANMSDGSNINMNTQDKDPGFKNITAQLLHDSLTETFSSAYGVEVEITDNYFTTDKLDGYPSYQYSISYEIQGVPIQQLIVGIDADKTYTFTYTDMSGNWMDFYEDSAQSIDLITED